MGQRIENGNPGESCVKKHKPSVVVLGKSGIDYKMRVGIKCPHNETGYFRVRFRNGTEHIQRQCLDCTARLDFVRADSPELAGKEIRAGLTRRAARIEVGEPHGCRTCGVDDAKISGVCPDCEKKGLHKKLWTFARARNKSAWDLTTEELDVFHAQRIEDEKTALLLDGFPR